MGARTTSIDALRRRRIEIAAVALVLFCLPFVGILTTIGMLKHEHANLVIESQRNQSTWVAVMAEHRDNDKQINDIINKRDKSDETQNAMLRRLLDRNVKLGADGVFWADRADAIADRRLVNSQLLMRLIIEMQKLVILFIACESVIWLVYSAAVF